MLVLAFSSGLSATYNSSAIAAEELREKYPERKIYTVDTLCASLGQGLLVWLAAKERAKGKTIDEVRDWAVGHKLSKMCIRDSPRCCPPPGGCPPAGHRWRSGPAPVSYTHLERAARLQAGHDRARAELDAWREKLQTQLDSRVFGQRRLMAAFPKMRSTSHRQAMEQLRRRMERRTPSTRK